MSARNLIVRGMLGTVLVIVLGMIGAVSGTLVIEPLYLGVGSAPSVIEGSPVMVALTWTPIAFLTLIAVLIAWMILAPIKNDVRQEF